MVGMPNAPSTPNLRVIAGREKTQKTQTENGFFVFFCVFLRPYSIPALKADEALAAACGAVCLGRKIFLDTLYGIC